MKIKPNKKIIVGLALLTFALSIIGFGHLNAQAKTTWHTGTPTAIRGTWYYNGAGSNKAYVTYSAHMSKGQYFEKSDADNTYYKLPGYGLKSIKYRYLGQRVYELTGIQYSPKGAKVQFDGKRMTYKVKAISKSKLYFYKGFHTYTKTPKFTVVKANHALS
ncbi:hypothetical protein [Secundilactobacillus kimchicus]|uniref:Uncharacterized protein n=1 Tax=Secundilactobacillus kimchicus JCM 15530 TaxID=1302272 RepID=A0A0R1HWI6_9LACO|nr:hypothetical protein [Secundilactobacillus kimchicus]KRK47873.1 hypothetical protein FC96_GL002078 [Secundilactobacillus kimchicus JCM 15530]MBT9671528.1 hypothetical protein [Secundilactobacillus kimchicus]